MSMVVIMPGGFHPFHAGHASLYQSALKAFPNADVYVAATNDTKTRPFPFEIKEKLAKVAGVAPGRFVQVKSPFQAKEILQNYNPEEDVVVFVRSEKDRDEQPKPGGTKKDGSPAYFQPYTGKNMEPFGKHGYMAYLPTVEFGPGIKSATEIRNIWPQLNDRRKLAMVMSLYPKAKENQRLAQNIVKMLDLGMGTEEVAEGRENLPPENFNADDINSLMRLKNLDDVKIQAFKLITNPNSSRPMKPNKVAWLKQRLTQLRDKQSVIKLLYDMLLSGEGNKVIGSRYSMEPNVYRKTFKELEESSENIYSARMAQIFKDLGDGYFLGDDSYDDDDGFTKEGYTVYYQEGDDQFRQVGTVSMSPYSNPPGHVENEIRKIIASDQNNLSESIDYLDEK
jgi:glycerol-3-phosphate cytidylyltransferase-like family protein